jgi:hypothetical protein
MSIERLHREARDREIKVKAFLQTVLKDVNETPNNAELGNKIRGYKKTLDDIDSMTMGWLDDKGK